MRYSLLSRFRGCFLGAALGETIGSSGEKQFCQPVGWGRMAVMGAESLIQRGTFDLEDWRDAMLSCEVVLPPFPASSKQDLVNQASLGATIAMLPLYLFYHENEIKLRQNLLAFVEIWQHNLVIRDSVLALGYVTIQALTEKLNRANLIPQTIDFLGSASQIAQPLAQVQKLLEQGAGLQKAITHLAMDSQPTASIALAFYCFLSTPEDLRLSILRAARTGYPSEITSAITGAMSGAYNSTSGIPTTLRMTLSRLDINPLAAWGIKTEIEMLELSDSLLLVWSGAYDKAIDLDEMMSIAAIAAPQVIRSC